MTPNLRLLGILPSEIEKIVPAEQHMEATRGELAILDSLSNRREIKNNANWLREVNEFKKLKKK